MARAGASLEQIDDAKLAVNEVVAAFQAEGRGAELAYHVDEETRYVTISNGTRAPTLSPMANRILSVTTAGFAPAPDESGFLLHLRPSARRGS
jgi:hypothetical protein